MLSGFTRRRRGLMTPSAGMSPFAIGAYHAISCIGAGSTVGRLSYLSIRRVGRLVCFLYLGIERVSCLSAYETGRVI